MSSSIDADAVSDVDVPTTLVPMEDPELVFGLVGAVGTDLKCVSEVLEAELEKVNYRCILIHITDLLTNLDIFKDLKEKTSSSEYDRISELMNAGNLIRRETKRKDIMAMLAIDEIRVRREKENMSLPKDNRPEEPAKMRLPRTAYIIHSLKNPEEIRTLRDTYGRACYIISAYSPRNTRIKSLAKRLAKSVDELDVNKYSSNAQELVDRDAKETDKYGQNLRNAFPQADFFVKSDHRKTLTEDIGRFIELLFGHPFHTPYKREFAMFHAFSASLRSADMGRQVGAAIASKDGEIIAIGCNEVPKAGGGLYWADDPGERRDFHEGGDTSIATRRLLVSDIVRRFLDNGWFSEKVTENRSASKLSQALLDGDSKEVLDGARVMDVIEFGRSVHAEMAAITEAAKRGVSLKDTILYCTTFPCHICARHIIAAGIKKVIYIEPYPKSQAEDLYNDSMVVDPESRVKKLVVFEPFVGIAPPMYHFLFEQVEERKDESSGLAVDWKGSAASPKLRRFAPSYILIEEDVLNNHLSPSLKKAKIEPQ